MNSRMNEAIILAGGMGSRLKSVVADLPKPMAPVNGKPFLSYLLRYLASQQIDRFILSVGYRHAVITDYFGDHYQSIPIDYVIEEEPLGTGGAISLAMETCQSKNIFILNGDTFFPVDLDRLRAEHLRFRAEVTLALKKIKKADRYGTIGLDETGRVTSFHEKASQAEALINGGIYLLNKVKFGKRTFSKHFSFEQDYLAQVVREQGIAGYIFDNYFIDIGIPESYRQAGKDFLTSDREAETDPPETPGFG